MKVPKEHPRSLRPWAIAGVLIALAAFAYAAWAVPRPSADPEEVWANAQAALKAGRIDAAAKDAARLARLRNPTPLDWFLRAQVAMARGRGDEAIDDLTRVPDDDPMAAQARLLSGQVELRRDRVAKAEAWLKEAVRLDPKLVQAHRELIFIYGMQLRRPELSREFLALSKLAPLTYDNVWHWCLTRNALWEPKESVSILRTYVAADPADRWSRIALADNLRRLQRFREADEALAPLPESDPDARAVRARVALDRGDDEASEALLAGGPPDHPELARMRGRLALARRDGPAAVKHFRAAYAAEPDDRDAVFGLGQALALVGDPAAAAPFQARARAFDVLGTLMQRASTAEGRSDPALMRALGSACEQVGRLPEARAWYRLAIQANPLDTESQKALYRLKDDATPAETARAGG